MQKALSQVVSRGLDLLFPLSCVVCGRDGRFVCESCVEELPVLEKPYCSSCARPGAKSVCHTCHVSPPRYNGIRAAYLMDGAAKNAVYALKYRDVRAYAPHMAELLATRLGAHALSGDVLVPVPLHRRRERSRGYNQSALLAKELSRHTGMVVEPELLARNRDTPPQVDLTGEGERRDNVEGAFTSTPAVGGRRVLLLDDVVTTGATMSACATALKAMGAKAVSGLAFARQG